MSRLALIFCIGVGLMAAALWQIFESIMCDVRRIRMNSDRIDEVVDQFERQDYKFDVTDYGKENSNRNKAGDHSQKSDTETRSE